MGFKTKLMLFILIVFIFGGVYTYYGITWTIITIIAVIVLYILYRIARWKKNTDEGDDEGGYLSGIFTD